ncbi:Eukaryotic translation initiation factor 5B [Morella rubra]|uniref:Eukaryotic translation initiation factor 5B n=1 Tax=Morella rubra TaxID=262757 RepID=A0A6A1WAN5_9ROSI|nr:Eukaryotic translation initiation factor 5B [Morella rubra]
MDQKKLNAPWDGENVAATITSITPEKVAITGEMKGEKGSAKAAKAKDDDGHVVQNEEDQFHETAFVGKKKKKLKKVGGHRLSSSSGFGLLGEEEDDQDERSGVVVERDSDGNDCEEVASFSKEEEEEKKKSKKKKKKNGTTAKEDDFDKNLPEIGEWPPTSKLASLAPQEEKLEVNSESVALADEKKREEESVESSAVKRKKKRKEKEKEKKAAAASLEVKDEFKTESTEPKKNGGKSNAMDKKVPKHVREMQEALARRKEAEERRKREEEERLRKEEEQKQKQEELQREAEEAKRRTKEKEKAKLQREKAEGKLLTPKQREEARRLEAMRKQILGNAGVLLPVTGSVTQTKRPYQNKKQKPTHRQANGAAPGKLEENVEAKDEPQETLAKIVSRDSEKDAEEEPEFAEAVEENEDEWDAKSWDYDAVNISIRRAFSDEEVESEPESVVKGAVPTSHNAAPPTAAKPTVAAKKTNPFQEDTSHNLDIEEKQATEHVEKTKEEDAALEKTPLSLDATFEQSEDNLRSPICCIMGHVDAGKTKLLDCIRGTNVQGGEAGGITQQIGATYLPAEKIRERTKPDATLKVPGLLVIDTPGHESFANLRSRGSGLCDIAILVVDIKCGLEQQTIESLNLLKMQNTKFIIALNKVDRLFGWKKCPNAPIKKALKQQSEDVLNEFNIRLTQIITQFKEQGLNRELYYTSKKMGETFSIVPTSAISGEGIPDLLLLLVQWTQKTMVEKLTYSNEVQCTVLEVKVVEGHGTTIDVIFVNGVLHEGDQIVGPIVTTIRALLTPHPMEELRVKGTYLRHNEVTASMVIKITAKGLQHAIAGTSLYVVRPDHDLEDVKEAAMADMKAVMRRIDRSGEGVYVQASTLGSLEALLHFLMSPDVNIPIGGIGIGPVHKKDVMKAGVMLEKKREYATILAFDVVVSQEAAELAKAVNVKIFSADVIFHLKRKFEAYIDELKEEKKTEAAAHAVFPCVLKILPKCIFHRKNPILLKVDVLEGIVKVGTPICIPQKDFIDIGEIASIENNDKPVQIAKKGQEVTIKIVGTNDEEKQKMYGRHFELDHELVSHISRESMDVLRANDWDELSREERTLVEKLEYIFKMNGAS